MFFFCVLCLMSAYACIFNVFQKQYIFSKCRKSDMIHLDGTFYIFQADLRLADFRAKQRAMEDALMALEVSLLPTPICQTDVLNLRFQGSLQDHLFIVVFHTQPWITQFQSLSLLSHFNSKYILLLFFVPFQKNVYDHFHLVVIQFVKNIHDLMVSKMCKL